jgi:hypothetical protein
MWALVTEDFSGVPLPDLAALVRHIVLSRAANSGMVRHKDSAVPIVLAARVAGASAAVMVEVALAASERLYHEKLLPELGAVQVVQFVQRRADGAASPLLVYHSGVPCLPTLR